MVGQRELVETRAALETGTMTNFLAASADWAATDWLTLIGLAGGQWFSDDNSRIHLRGTAIFGLWPAEGLSAQARIRGYQSSDVGSGRYFNPGNYERADIGLRLRRGFAGWRTLAAAGIGKERIEREFEHPTYYIDVGAERPIAGKVNLALTLSIAKTSDSDSASTGGNYVWRYLRAVFIVPL